MDARTRDSALALELPSDREIVLTRVFNAPRRLVFDAWTKPEHVKRWYGCAASTMTSCDIDLRPGGAYRFVLRMQDGLEHSLSGVYREIVPPARIVCTERINDDPNMEALIAVTFEERRRQDDNDQHGALSDRRGPQDGARLRRGAGRVRDLRSPRRIPQDDGLTAIAIQRLSESNGVRACRQGTTSTSNGIRAR